MSEKTRYFKIGLFTLFALVLLVIGLLMFGAGTALQPPPLLFETFFANSVQGLDVGALVKLNGVRIGKVKDIGFVKDRYAADMSVTEVNSDFTMIYVDLELESRYFQKTKGKSPEEIQKIIDQMVKDETFRAKLQSIGITGLVYVELGFYDPKETLPPPVISWTPENIYIPSAPGVATRFGAAVDKLLNKMDSDIYPMMENLNKASTELPSLVVQLNEVMPRVNVIARNIEDITSTAKKYPSQLIFGEAPPKSRFDQ